jgi:hypothetical protein
MSIHPSNTSSSSTLRSCHHAPSFTAAANASPTLLLQEQRAKDSSTYGTAATRCDHPRVLELAPLSGSSSREVGANRGRSVDRFASSHRSGLLGGICILCGFQKRSEEEPKNEGGFFFWRSGVARFFASRVIMVWWVDPTVFFSLSSLNQPPHINCMGHLPSSPVQER